MPSKKKQALNKAIVPIGLAVLALIGWSTLNKAGLVSWDLGTPGKIRFGLSQSSFDLPLLIDNASTSTVTLNSLYLVVSVMDGKQKVKIGNVVLQNQNVDCEPQNVTPVTLTVKLNNMSVFVQLGTVLKSKKAVFVFDGFVRGEGIALTIKDEKRTYDLSTWI